MDANHAPAHRWHIPLRPTLEKLAVLGDDARTMARELAVVLVNASLNSTVACALAAQRHRTVLLNVETSVIATTVTANQQRFDALVAHVKPYRSHRINLPPLIAGRGEHGAPVPRGTDVATTLLEQLPLIALALRLAANAGATALYAGHRVGPEAAALARITEHAQVWGELVQVTCDRPTLEIQLPLLELEPWQVIDLAAQVNAPLQLSWECEHNGGVTLRDGVRDARCASRHSTARADQIRCGR